MDASKTTTPLQLGVVDGSSGIYYSFIQRGVPVNLHADGKNFYVDGLKSLSIDIKGQIYLVGIDKKTLDQFVIYTLDERRMPVIVHYLLFHLREFEMLKSTFGLFKSIINSTICIVKLEDGTLDLISEKRVRQGFAPSSLPSRVTARIDGRDNGMLTGCLKATLDSRKQKCFNWESCQFKANDPNAPCRDDCACRKAGHTCKDHQTFHSHGCNGGCGLTGCLGCGKFVPVLQHNMLCDTCNYNNNLLNTICGRHFRPGNEHLIASLYSVIQIQLPNGLVTYLYKPSATFFNLLAQMMNVAI